jgi:hypothetical protein
MDEESNLNETLKAIQSAIAEREANIERGEKLKRLKDNPDFQDVILKGYIEDVSKELFKILTDPTGASPYPIETIYLKLGSISDLKAYIGTEEFKGTVQVKAEQAPLEIEREQDYRKELTAQIASEDI